MGSGVEGWFGSLFFSKEETVGQVGGEVGTVHVERVDAGAELMSKLGGLKLSGIKMCEVARLAWQGKFRRVAQGPWNTQPTKAHKRDDVSSNGQSQEVKTVSAGKVQTNTVQECGETCRVKQLSGASTEKQWTSPQTAERTTRSIHGVFGARIHNSHPFLHGH